jgi:hypothetical protein
VSENDFWRGILLLVAYSLAYASRGEWDQQQIMIVVAVVNPLILQDVVCTSRFHWKRDLTRRGSRNLVLITLSSRAEALGVPALKFKVLRSPRNRPTLGHTE